MTDIANEVSATPLAHTIDSAIRSSGTSRTVIYDALKNKELRAVKKGSRTLILEADLAAWVRTFPPAEFGKHRGVKGRQRRTAEQSIAA